MLDSVYTTVSVKSTLNKKKEPKMEKANLQETIIYGGAFNRPTLAHQAILQGCVDYAEPRHADVWLMPSASRVDKAISVERSERLEFCAALTRDVLSRTVRLGIETLELDRSELTETYDTVRELDAQYPDRTFTWVFGADSVATMETWVHGRWLQDNLSMLVINRPGTPLPNLGPRAVELAVEAGSYSSTELRRRLANGEAYDDMVGPEVGRLIDAKNAMLEVC